jgi:hypothetical protein
MVGAVAPVRPLLHEMGRGTVSALSEWHVMGLDLHLLVFMLVWVAICAASALSCGWWSLAKRFRARGPTQGRRCYLASGCIGEGWSFGRSCYTALLVLTVNDTGVRIAVLPLIRVMHPPLFIPWAEVEFVSEKRGFLVHLTTIHIRGNWPIVELDGYAGGRVAETYSRVTGRGVSAAP